MISPNNILGLKVCPACEKEYLHNKNKGNFCFGCGWETGLTENLEGGKNNGRQHV